MAQGPETGLGLRWARLALVIVLVAGVSMIFGVLELWPPPIAVEPLTVVAWVVVGLLDLLMGTPPGILGGPLGPIVGLMGVVRVTVLAVAGFIVIEVNRRRRVSLLPPSDE